MSFVYVVMMHVCFKVGESLLCIMQYYGTGIIFRDTLMYDSKIFGWILNVLGGEV